MSKVWRRKHLTTLRAKYGGDSTEVFRPEYEALEDDAKLVEITIPTLRKLFDLFEVDTTVFRSSEIDSESPDDPSEKLVRLVTEVGGDRYISGGTGYRNYLREELFEERDIEVAVQDWTPSWEHGNVCALDVLFSTGNPHEFIVSG